ncbi:MAG TPA: glycine cleavage system aminomethyltransferase GcvT, partial [Candidatus Limnocylindrales bacterium]
MTEAHEPTVHRTPLTEVHRELGARLIEFGGWLMPVQYGSILEEHRAVRERVGLFDLSHMGELHVEGPDAGAALAAALVTNPPSLAIGRAQYSMICMPDGGVIDDLIVYRLAESRFLVVANAGNAATVSDTLAERLGRFKAVLDDRSLATGLLAVQGPLAAGVLGPLTDVDLGTLRYYAIAEGAVAGIPAMVARTGYTGEDGFEVFVDTDRTAELWAILLAAVRSAGGLPVGLGARDTLRLEAGMPLYGNELDRSTNPYEANLGRVVKLAKPGDFVGRSALERVARDGVERTLVGLVMRGRGIARHGYPVWSGERASGVVTSGTQSPSLGEAI